LIASKCPSPASVTVVQGATLVAMIPAPAQEFMSQRAGSTVERIPGSHSIYVSQPQAVASLIKEAAKGTKAAAQTS
jgi:carboxypeptidase C (cathepsin A)